MVIVLVVVLILVVVVVVVEGLLLVTGKLFLYRHDCFYLFPCVGKELGHVRRRMKKHIYHNISENMCINTLRKILIHVRFIK